MTGSTRQGGGSGAVAGSGAVVGSGGAGGAPEAPAPPPRRLGRHELLSSPVALGCMGMSEFYGPADDEASVRTIHEAIEHGVTMLDTADVYGPFTNEKLVGRALRGRRAGVTVMTKVGQLRKADDPTFRGLDGSAAHIRRSCEASLRRLEIDAIDVYVLHRVDPATPVEESVAALADLVTAGKVRHIGLSEVRPETLRRACAVADISVVQTEYSLWSRDVEQGLLAAMRELGVGLVAYAPLGRGFLSGGIVPDQLAGDDYRRGLPRFQPGNYEHNRRLLDRFTGLARDWSYTPAELALAWVLHQGTDIVALVGTTSSRHLAENLQATRRQLSKEQLDQLDDLFGPAAVSGDRYASRRTIDG